MTKLIRGDEVALTEPFSFEDGAGKQVQIPTGARGDVILENEEGEVLARFSAPNWPYIKALHVPRSMLRVVSVADPDEERS